MTDMLAKHYAHRGYHDKPMIPENSMAAFMRAVEYGLPSELDVHLIADGSLVVFHDELLERETGAPGEIEDYDITNLKKLKLEGTDETIPTFDEVLDLYEDTDLPLLIELKVSRGNYKKLAEAVCERLDSYTGPFAVQSFDPRVLMAVKRLRPGIRRGLLSQNFFKSNEGQPRHRVAMLSDLWFRRLVKPDFIAYKFKDRGNKALRRAVDRDGVTEMSWIIKSAKAYRAAVKAGCTPIFEKISPEELEELGIIKEKRK